jgi:lipid-A-disaccharide synthase
MYESAKRIMIVTGEASGDLHGANLIKAVNALSADTRFFGAGGQKMAAAGCDILIPGEDLAVMGVFEVFGQLPVIWRSFQRLKKELFGRQKPDALVLIDFPDFNLRLAKQAKKAGVPVLYYISPKIWAWRQGRVKKIAERVDSLAVIFPFEPALYDGLDVLVKYVGHPLLDEFAASSVPRLAVVLICARNYRFQRQRKSLACFLAVDEVSCDTCWIFLWSRHSLSLIRSRTPISWCRLQAL